jgi:hypothetical protein
MAVPSEVANHFICEINFKLATQHNANMPFFAPVGFNKFMGELDDAQYFSVTRKGFESSAGQRRYPLQLIKINGENF